MKEKVLADLMKFREEYLKNGNDIEKNNGDGVNKNMNKDKSDDDKTRKEIEKENEEMRIGMKMNQNNRIKDRNEENEEEVQFNAAKYLYSSWRVAALFPEIPESKLILQFETPWPKKKFGKEQEKNLTKEYQDDVIMTTLSRILVYFLTSLLQFNTLIQDIVIQIVTNSGLGYVCLLLIRLAAIHPSLPVLVVLALVLSVYLLLKFSSGGLLKKLLNEEGKKMIHPLVESTPLPNLNHQGSQQQLHLQEEENNPSIPPPSQNVEEGIEEDVWGSSDDSIRFSFGDFAMSDSSSGIPPLENLFLQVDSSDDSKSRSESDSSNNSNDQESDSTFSSMDPNFYQASFD